MRRKLGAPGGGNGEQRRLAILHQRAGIVTHHKTQLFGAARRFHARRERIEQGDAHELVVPLWHCAAAFGQTGVARPLMPENALLPSTVGYGTKL